MNAGKEGDSVEESKLSDYAGFDERSGQLKSDTFADEPVVRLSSC